MQQQHSDAENAGAGAAPICPHLAVLDDPSTACAFPAPANHCFHTQPAAPVHLAHQEQFCLTANHAACPLFSYSEQPLVNRELRRELAAASILNMAPRRTLRPGGRAVAAAALVLLALLFLVGWSNRGAIAGWFGAGPTPPARAIATPAASPMGIVAGEELSPTSTRAATASATLAATATIAAPATERPATAMPAAPATSSSTPATTASATGTATSLPTPAASEEVVVCAPRSDWTGVHIVQAGETLFRISLRYNSSTAAFQEANCLEDSTVFAGQRLVAPFQLPAATSVPASSTPAATNTAPPPAPQATSEPATPAPPPTATPVPPTATVVLPTPTAPVSTPTAPPPVP